MYNLKRICAHDDLTLGHWLASKKCFPVQQINNNIGTVPAKNNTNASDNITPNDSTQSENSETPSNTNLPNESADFMNGQIGSLKESLQVHASLDAFLQLSCTACPVVNIWKILKKSIFKIEEVLDKKLGMLLNQNYLIVNPSLCDYEFLLLINGTDTTLNKPPVNPPQTQTNSENVSLICCKKSEKFNLSSSISSV
jgi:hypothetical protein